MATGCSLDLKTKRGNCVQQRLNGVMCIMCSSGVDPAPTADHCDEGGQQRQSNFSLSSGIAGTVDPRFPDSVPHRVSVVPGGGYGSEGEDDDDDHGNSGVDGQSIEPVGSRSPATAGRTNGSTASSSGGGGGVAASSAAVGDEPYRDRSGTTEAEVLRLRDAMLEARRLGITSKASSSKSSSSIFHAIAAARGVSGSADVGAARSGQRAGRGGGRNSNSSRGARENGTTCRANVSDPFPTKLYRMLDETHTSDLDPNIVTWLPHGRAFIVRDTTSFVNTVMPTYFKQTKITSFQRQLNLYGFRRILHGRDTGGYYHEFFLRGLPHLCRGMVRTKVKGTGHGSRRRNGKKKTTSRARGGGVVVDQNLPQQPDFYSMPPVSGTQAGTSSSSATATTTTGPKDTEDASAQDDDGSIAEAARQVFSSSEFSPPPHSRRCQTEEQRPPSPFPPREQFSLIGCEISSPTAVRVPTRNQAQVHPMSPVSFDGDDGDGGIASSSSPPNEITPSPIPTRFVEVPGPQAAGMARLRAFVAPPPLYAAKEEVLRLPTTENKNQSGHGPNRVPSWGSNFEEGRVDGPGSDIAYEPKGLFGPSSSSKRAMVEERSCGHDDGEAKKPDDVVSSAAAAAAPLPPQLRSSAGGAKNKRLRRAVGRSSASAITAPFNYLDKFDPVLASILSSDRNRRPGDALLSNTSPLSSGGASCAGGAMEGHQTASEAAGGLWYDHLNSCDFGDYLSVVDGIEDDVGFGRLLENLLDDCA